MHQAQLSSFYCLETILVPAALEAVWKYHSRTGGQYSKSLWLTWKKGGRAGLFCYIVAIRDMTFPKTLQWIILLSSCRTHLKLMTIFLFIVSVYHRNGAICEVVFFFSVVSACFPFLPFSLFP